MYVISHQEDQHVPEPVQVRKAQAGPCVAEELVVDPTGDG